MSKAKAKGTRGENEVVDILVDAGFPRADPDDPLAVGVARLRGGWDTQDIGFVGMPSVAPWIIEAKYRKAWHLFKWIRVIRKRADGCPWVIFAIHGDRRTAEGREVGAVAIMDADFAAELMRHYEGELL